MNTLFRHCWVRIYLNELFKLRHHYRKIKDVFIIKIHIIVEFETYVRKNQYETTTSDTYEESKY